VKPIKQQESELDQLRHGLTSAPTTWAKAVWMRFRHNYMAMAGLFILIILILMTIFAPVIAELTTGWGRDEIDIRYVLTEPSARHPLGTDSVGRDNWTRLIYGGRVSMIIAFSTVGIYMIVGVLIGAVAGYFGGWLDNVLMRLADIILAFPFLLLALTIVAIRGPGIENLIFAIVVLSWPVPARLIRGEFLSLRERDYVEAARAVGAPAHRIMFRHMLPNALAPLLVSATLDIAGIILFEAALSYLGFGIPLPIPTWGNMLSEVNNMAVLTRMPWLWLPPGLMIFLTVISINFVGDGLRDALDPRLKS
jgi:peptide/nickel transport system permease protein